MNLISMLQSFFLYLPVVFSILLFIASNITNIDLKTKIKIKYVFFKFTQVISIAFYAFHIMSCFYWVALGGGRSNFKYYFKLLVQSIKFYQFNDTVIILLPLIFAAISIIFVYLKNRVVNRILFIKIQGPRNESPPSYDVLIRVLYIFMFVFILIIGHFGNLVCHKVITFEKIGICKNNQSTPVSLSFWYYQGFVNSLYISNSYPLFELVNLI